MSYATFRSLEMTTDLRRCTASPLLRRRLYSVETEVAQNRVVPPPPVPPRARVPSRAERGAPVAPDTVMIVRDVLRAALVRGQYASSPLPSEPELQRMFGATRSTIRTALAILTREGIIHRVRGTGTFMGAEKIRQPGDGFQGLGGVGSSIFHVVAERRVIDAPELTAPLLGIDAGVPMLYLRRKTITADGAVVSMFSSYLSLPLGEPLNDPSADLSGEYYATLERLLGRRILEDRVVLEASCADEYTAAEMQIEVGAPVMQYERLIRLDHDEPLEFGVGFQRGDRIRILRERMRN